MRVRSCVGLKCRHAARNVGFCARQVRAHAMTVGFGVFAKLLSRLCARRLHCAFGDFAAACSLSAQGSVGAQGGIEQSDSHTEYGGEDDKEGASPTRIEEGAPQPFFRFRLLLPGKYCGCIRGIARLGRAVRFT